ncbi:MAG: zinc-ribbon domain containing protein [Negativicutes bacterium]|nr:zinc-ribbon domain containing protein [Negativicutes bacterium]
MSYVDKTLKCKECGCEFVFSANEQEFYAEKGFQNEPSRCSSCRQARKQNRNEGRRSGPREWYETTCSDCGATAKVPFNPTAGKPVYCNDCYQNHK